jgi:hypothetical protein
MDLQVYKACCGAFDGDRFSVLKLKERKNASAWASNLCSGEIELITEISETEFAAHSIAEPRTDNGDSLALFKAS